MVLLLIEKEADCLTSQIKELRISVNHSQTLIRRAPTAERFSPLAGSRTPLMVFNRHKTDIHNYLFANFESQVQMLPFRLNLNYFRLNTSCISYSPALFDLRKRAARRAPNAKVARLLALWVISTRSPIPANNTVWSPTISPPRTVAKPIVEGSRSPVTPSRPYTAHFSKSRPNVRATTSPIPKAVPEGAST